MPAGWADIIESLRSWVGMLPPATSGPEAEAVTQQLLDASQALSRAVETLPADPPSQRQRAQLVECMCGLGDRLAELARSRPWAKQRWSSMHMVNVVGAGCMLLGACGNLGTACALSVEEAGRFWSGAALVCTGGADFMEQLALDLQRAEGAAAGHVGVPPSAAVWLHVMVNALSGLLGLLAPSPSLSAYVPPPDAVVRWLDAAALLCAQVERLGGGQAPGLAAARVALGGVVGKVFEEPGLVQHALVLMSHRQVQLGLAKALLPAVPALAVGLQLPAERREAWCNWPSAARVAVALSHTDAIDEVCSSVPSAGGSGGDALVKLLQAAALLFQNVPPDGFAEPAAFGLLLVQAGVSYKQRLEGGGEPPAPEAQQRLARALLPTLPKLAGMLRAAARAQAGLPGAQAELEPQGGRGGVADSRQQLHILCVLLHGLLQLLPKFLHVPDQGAAVEEEDEAAMTISDLDHGMRSWLSLAGDPLPRPPGFSPGDLAAWFESAAAALQAVQLAAELGPLGAWEGREGRTCPASLATSALTLAGMVAATAQNDASLGGDWGSASAAEARLAGLWTLHTSVCRLFWFGRGGSRAAALLPCLRPDRLLADHFNLLVLPTVFASGLLPPPQAALAPDLRARAERTLQAMAAAQVEAMLCALEGGAAGEVLRADAGRAMMAASALQVALKSGPLALAARPEVQALLSRLLVTAGATGHANVCYVVLTGLLTASAARAPQLVALLLADGALDALVSDVGRPNHTQLVTDCAASVPFALHKLSIAGAAEVADAAGGSALSDDERALLAGLDRCQRDLSAALQPYFPGGRAVLNAPSSKDLARMLPPAARLAEALLAWWRRPEAEAERRLALARAAAARSCAYLRCANLQRGGGPAAGQGEGSFRCSGCRVAWYCDEACSHADWRGPSGHRKACRALGEERRAERARARQAAGQAAGQ